MTGRTSRALSSLLLSAALIVAASGGVALAAKKEKGKDRAAEPQAPAAAIESVPGARYRMARSRMAKRVTRLQDEAADQLAPDGAPAAGAPGWSDIEAVYVAPIRMPAKLLTMMAKDFPPGVPRSFYGAQADWRKGDRAVFVAVQMADRLPPEVGRQQVEVGLAGDGALPLQVGTTLDPRAGVERFSLSGVFEDGRYGTGTTDVRGRQPGGDIDYYNTDSRVFGYYDPKVSTWYLIMPRTEDDGWLRVSVRSSTGEGQLIDHLELPGGGAFVELADPAAGWDGSAGQPLLDCRSLETYSAASELPLSDPDATLIRYTSGMDAAVEPETVAAALSPAVDRMGSVPVLLSPVGSGAVPQTVEGELSVAPGGNAVALSFEAPPGQWVFALDEAGDLVTPAGERIIDHGSLTGPAGVRTGPGLDGLVAGDLSCAIAGMPPTEDPADADGVEATDGAD